MALIAELLAVPADGRYPALAVSPQQKREMTLTALLDQLDGVAAQSPVLIVFEDAHWIDPTSQDLLDRTVARVANLPVLLVVTVRPELQPTWVGEPHVTMLPLSRLGRRDSAGIIGGVTKDKALPDAVVEQVLAHTDGVPLFIEELTSTLLESGLLRETADRYVLDGPLPPLAIPTTLQASLVARLDRLASVKDVAQIGAAIGREFSHELIAAVSALAPMDLDAALERLTASGLISRRGTPPDATYSFKHALVQDAAYATMLKSRRRQLHASIAKVLVERFPAMAERLPEVVAHHFTEAGLASEAIGYWLKAGRLAYARSANREAVKSFEQALHLLEALPESQSTLEQGFDLRLELRPVLGQLGEGRRMLERLREAEALAERLNDDRRRGRVYAFMTITHSLLGELDEALVTGSRALEIAGRLGDLRLRILATSYLVQAHYVRGEYDRVIELATGNLAALPADWVYENFGLAGPPSVWDRAWLIMSLAELGRFAEAAKYEAEAIRLAEPTQHALHHQLGPLRRGHAPSPQGRLGPGALTDRALDRGVPDGELPPPSLGDRLLRLGTGAARRGERGTEPAQGRRAAPRASGGERNSSPISAGPTTRWVAPVCCSADSTKRGAWATARSNPLRLSPGSRPMRCTCSATSRPIPTGSTHKAARPTTARRWRSPSRAACARSSPTATSASASSTGAQASGEQAQEHLTTATTMYREMGMRFWLEQAEAEMRQLR